MPDWLSVADRKVRMRSKHVAPFDDNSGSIQAQLAAGVLRHLDDDRWFHQTRAFVETTATMASEFRRVIGVDDNFRPGFLGHITTELLLDAELMQRYPGRLEEYYTALTTVDADQVQTAVNRMSRVQSTNLADFVRAFCDMRFLFDYEDSSRLLGRLNQVMRRVKLDRLPPEVIGVLNNGRKIVAAAADALLSRDSIADG